MNINIRNVRMSDLDEVVAIENLCFPAEEAASPKALKERISAFEDHFFVAEAGNRLIGFINGSITNHPTIYDEMFHDISQHIPTGQNFAIFGLDVIPEYRNRGVAAELMETFLKKGRETGKKAVILTCKQHLVHYYEKFGFVSNGVSESTHGGATWFDMTCTL